MEKIKHYYLKIQ